MNAKQVTWGRWGDLGDGKTQQRYIDALVVDGVLWRADDGGGMVGPDGFCARDAGRGEMRVGRETSTVYGSDGADVPGNPDPAEDCGAAIREATENRPGGATC